ncbi:hypothetical protein J6590_093053 [Homalodisca vitripennis]|nr:hypothetical protein J6590_093053 [Homalodisca vitripennis]
MVLLGRKNDLRNMVMFEEAIKRFRVEFKDRYLDCADAVTYSGDFVHQFRTCRAPGEERSLSIFNWGKTITVLVQQGSNGQSPLRILAALLFLLLSG